MQGVNAIICSTKVMKNCSATGTRAFDIPFRCMDGGPAGGVCRNADLEIVVQSSGGLAMSWQGGNGLSASSFPMCGHDQFGNEVSGRCP